MPAPPQLLRNPTPAACCRSLPAAQVLDASPWVAPRPLYLLVVPPRQGQQQQRRGGAASALPPPPLLPPTGGDDGEAAAAGQTYTLRTRVARGDTADELSLVLRLRAADGGPLIACSELKDGVVAFEDEGDAQRYARMLEKAAAGGEAAAWGGSGGASVEMEAGIARCDSHALFRTVQDVKAVVVLLRTRHGSDEADGDGDPLALLPQPHQLAASLRSGGEGGQPGGGDQPLF